MSAVAVSQIDRHPVAVTCSWDGTVRIWDLMTGRPRGEPLVGHAGPAPRPERLHTGTRARFGAAAIEAFGGQPRQSDGGVGFVDDAEGRHPQGILIDTAAVAEPGLAFVAGFGVDAIQFDHGGKHKTRKPKIHATG